MVGVRWRSIGRRGFDWRFGRVPGARIERLGGAGVTGKAALRLAFGHATDGEIGQRRGGGLARCHLLLALAGGVLRLVVAELLLSLIV